MKGLFLPFLLAAFKLRIAAAQSTTDSGVTDYSDIDPAFIQFPDDGINYPGCFQDLAAADRNKDGVIKANEYLGFVQTYGKRICHYTDRLTLRQRSAFNALACKCQSREGYSKNCCLGNNAQIETAGALDGGRTQDQLSYLTAVCRITDGTISEPRGCPPVVIDPNEPPPYVFIPAAPATTVAPAGGLTPGQLAGIIIAAIIAALLLLLCCFCCIFAAKKKKEDEEEEEKVLEEEDVEVAPEQNPAMAEREMEAQSVPPPPPPPPVVVPPPPVEQEHSEYDEEEIHEPKSITEYEEEEVTESGRGAAIIQDEEEDEDVRKGRGSANIPPVEEEPKRRIVGAGVIPDPQPNPERVVLRPIEQEEEENPDWDFPGQAVNYPTEKDEMSAGEVEHYEPDGGVYIPERPANSPLDWRKEWNRPEVEDPDEHDNRKHRIQAGLGEGEVWDTLAQREESTAPTKDNGDVFDWVVQSALGVLSDTEKAGHLDGNNQHQGPN